MTTIQQQIENLKYELWETGAKEHIAETQEAITGVPAWQRELAKARQTPVDFYGYTPTTATVRGTLAQREAAGWVTGVTPGKGKIWFQKQAETRRWQAAQRIALTKRIAELTRRAEQQRKLAEAKERAIELRRTQQQARQRGVSITRIKEERKAITQKQLQVVQVAEGLRGKDLTRTQYQKELSLKTGLPVGEAISTLREGTKRIRIEKLKPVSPTYYDPTKEGFIISEGEGTRYIEPTPSQISFADIGGTDVIFQGYDFTGKLDIGGIPKPTYKIKEIKDVTREGTLATPLPEFPIEALPPSPLTVEKVEKPSWLEGLSQKQETALLRGATGLGLAEFGVGLGLSLQTGVETTGKLVTAPIKTTKEIITSIPELPKQLPAIMSTIETRPSFALGYATGEIAQAKALGLGISKFKRIKITKPLRPVRTPYFTEKQMFVVSKGKEIKLSTYDILGEYKPPMVEKITTPFRESLGFKPIKVKYIPPKKFSIKTLGYAVGEKPFDVSLVKAGKRTADIFEVRGVSKFIEPRVDIAKLTKVEKFALGKLRPPAPEKFLGKMFKRGADISLSDIEITKLARAKPSTKALSLKLKEAGKLRELSKAITETKPLLETPSTRIFTSETYFKDVTKPFARAIGKTPKLKGIIYQLKEPLILDAEKVAKFISPVGIKKTPLAKTFQELKTKQIFTAPKPIIKIPEVKTTMKIIAPPKIKTPALASLSQLKLVTGLGVIEGRFPRGILGEKIIIKPKVKEISKLKEITKIKQISKVKEISKLKEITKIKQVPKVKQVSKLKEITKLKQISKLKQLQKLKLIPKLKLLTKPKTKYTPFPIPLKIPKVPEKIITPPKILFGEPRRRIPRAKYVVSVRRFGKFRPIGKLPSLSKAFSFGRERVSKTLAASFKVTGYPLKRERLPKGFRLSKKERGVFIEKRKFRLSKLPEVKEIQLYKRKKKRRKKKK